MAHVRVSPGAEALSYSAVKLFSKNLKLCDQDIAEHHTQTDGQTDRRTIYDRNSVLCTKVHRALISRLVLGRSARGLLLGYSQI